MKSIKRIVAVVIACVAIAVPASAQFAFGDSKYLFRKYWKS